VSERDYYKILGIAPDANYEAVDAAYWWQVRESRDKLALDPQALPALNEAYEVLRTPALREKYDASRAAALSAAATQGADALTLPRPVSQARPGGVKPRLPWGRQAAEERAAATAIIVGRLEREVHSERERMRADLEAELSTPDDDGTARSRLMRVFGHLQQS
jgi:curved DNA-binding protein CbpA